jgi:hypothetical protein
MVKVKRLLHNEKNTSEYFRCCHNKHESYLGNVFNSHCTWNLTACVAFQVFAAVVIEFLPTRTTTTVQSVEKSADVSEENVALKIEAKCSSETSIDFQGTPLRYIPQARPLLNA